MHDRSCINRREFLQKNMEMTKGLGLFALVGSVSQERERHSGKKKPITRPMFKVRTPVREPLPGVYLSAANESVYVIECGDKGVLVDSGFHHNVDDHLENFESAGVILEKIEAILVTHYHVDHTGGLDRVKKRLNCPVFAHKNSVEIIESGDKAATAASMPYIGWDFPYPSCKVDEVIEDGDEIRVGDVAFRVVHLPGHTPGCTGYLWDGKLITGDVLFSLGNLGWGDVHWGTNYQDLIETMRRIADLNPEFLLPTHGIPFRFEKSITKKGEVAARDMLEGNRASAIKHTMRAPLSDSSRVPRKVVVS